MTKYIEINIKIPVLTFRTTAGYSEDYGSSTERLIKKTINDVTSSTIKILSEINEDKENE